MKSITSETPGPAELHCSRPTADALQVELSGHWRLQRDVPSATTVAQQLDATPGVQRLTFETQGLAGWDSGLVTCVLDILALGAQRQLVVDQEGLPSGLRRLLHLATAVPERQGARREAARDSMLARIGKAAIASTGSSVDTLGFLGEACLAFLKLLRRRARFRGSDFVQVVQECGAEALPIVSLISFLVGAILAFIGAVQLQQFGAQAYVANLVGLAMALEMGAMMTAIIMAGRTGAAFAAQLGTMQVNQEIDALTTMGFAPMEFLVLPRMLALMLMVPLLTVYADLMGIVGGAVIGAGLLDVSPRVYFHQLQEGLTLKAFAQGLIKSAVYGGIVALAGCLRGIQCGRSAAAVGKAATSAVVTSIVGIIVASAILTVIYIQVW